MSGSADLTGRSVLLTGSVGDIGAAYLEAFVRAGANVVATDLAAASAEGSAAAEKVAAAGPGRAVFVPADVTSDENLGAAVSTAVTEFGGLDAVIHNAALYRALGAKRALTDLTVQDWDTVLRVNVRGTWQTIRAAVPALRRRGGGSIVTVASTVSRTGPPGFAHYVASKAAVEGLTRAAARELGGDEIRVNAVAPGLVDDAASRALNDPAYLDNATRSRCLPRAMVAEDLIGAVLWLAGPASAFMTGQTLVVDGGGVFT